QTWREFWRDLPELHRVWLDFPSHGGQVDDAKGGGFPCDDSSFEPSLLPGYGEDEFPGFAHTYGDSWMPVQLRDKYAKRVDSLVSGSWNVYPSQFAEELAAALRSLGYVLRLDSELIMYSCSYHAAVSPL